MLDDHEPVRSSEAPDTNGANDRGQVGVSGNERLTALAGALLLVLILIELASAVDIHVGITLHVVVGVLLSAPLLVKLGSTGYRFLRYYTGASAYRRKGPPYLPLRLLAPLLVIATLAVTGSGIGLVVTGPQRAGLLLPLHNLSVLFWLSLIAIHVCAYLASTLRLLGDDWLTPGPGSQRNRRWLRLSVNLAALLCGVAATILFFPAVAPWVAWSQAGQNIAAPLIVGSVLAALALLASRPWKWRKSGSS